MPAGSSNQYVYQVGATQIIVGASLATQCNPPKGAIAWSVGYLSGGTLSLVNAATLTAGYVLGTTETVNCDGPGVFFLGAASGTTAIAKVLFKYSSGFSLFP